MKNLVHFINENRKLSQKQRDDLYVLFEEMIDMWYSHGEESEDEIQEQIDSLLSGEDEYDLYENWILLRADDEGIVNPSQFDKEELKEMLLEIFAEVWDNM